MRIHVLVVFLSLHLRNLSCYDDIDTDDDSGEIIDKSETDYTLEPEPENMDISDCDTGRPEFSHVSGQPNVSEIWGNQSISAIEISWSLSQLLGAPSCADAFEVEFQSIGGGRLSWSAWSAMVNCAPTRRNQTSFTCLKQLNSRLCSSRIRFRVLPHNSRNHAMTALGSPHQEIIIRCTQGVPVQVLKNKHSVGRQLTPLSAAGRDGKLREAMARDDLLKKIEIQRAWLRKRRRTTTTTTTTSTTTTTTTTIPTTTSTTTTISAAKPTSKTIRTPNPGLNKVGSRRMDNPSYADNKVGSRRMDNPSYADNKVGSRRMDNPSYADPTLGDEYYDYEYDYEYPDQVEPEMEKTEEVQPTCLYSGWDAWTECTTLCGSGTRTRSRSVLQGLPGYCEFTNQTKSCFGRSCSMDLDVVVRERATLLPGKYGKGRDKKEYEVRSNLKNFTEDENTQLYCIQFQVVHGARSCETKPEVSALRRGNTVCALCTSKAVREGDQGCVGGGVQDKVTSYRMLLETRCQGTWRKLEETELCSCSENSTFIFV